MGEHSTHEALDGCSVRGLQKLHGLLVCCADDHLHVEVLVVGLLSDPADDHVVAEPGPQLGLQRLLQLVRLAIQIVPGQVVDHEPHLVLHLQAEEALVSRY